LAKEFLRKLNPNLNQLDPRVNRTLALSIIAILATTVLVALGLVFTGFFVAGEEKTITQDLNLDVNETTQYAWLLSEPGPLTSAKLSGKWSGIGQAKVWLVSGDGSKQLLVLDTDNLKPPELTISPLTGFSVTEEKDKDKEAKKDEKDKEKKSDEGSTGSDSGAEAPSDQQGSPQSEQPADGQQTEPPAEETPSEEPPVEEQPGIEPPPAEQPEETNETEQQNDTTEQPPAEEIPPEEPVVTEISFAEICEETCSLQVDLNDSSYTLLIEISSGAELQLDSVAYSIVLEDIPVIENITNDTVFFATTIRDADNNSVAALIEFVDPATEELKALGVSEEGDPTIEEIGPSEPEEQPVEEAPSAEIQPEEPQNETSPEENQTEEASPETIEVSPLSGAAVSLLETVTPEAPPAEGGVIEEAPGAPGVEIPKSEYSIRVKPQNHVVQEIVFADLVVQENVTEFIKMGLVPDELVEAVDPVQSYAIDPTGFNFSSALVTVIAQGRELYKCASWDFANQTCGTVCEIDEEGETSCYENWTLVKSITPGLPYSFTLTQDDPAYYEVAPTADVSLIPLTNTTFAVGFIDTSQTDASFRVLNTNGTIITNTVDADTTVDNASNVALTPINTTQFAFGWIDGIDDDATFATYFTNGTNIVAATDVDTSVLDNVDVSLAQMGDRFVICYMDDTDDDASFQIRFNNGTSVVGEIDIDTGAAPEATLQNLVSCSAISSTRFVFFYFDDPSNDATFAIRSETGASIVGNTDVDTDVGETGQVATASLDGNKFVMVFYDATDQDITTEIRYVNNTVIQSATDIDTAAGTESRVAVAAVRRNSSATQDDFVVVWFDQAAGNIQAAVFDNAGATVTSPFVVDANEHGTFRLLDVAGRDSVTNNTLCPGRFIVAYSNTSNVGNFQGFHTNGTSWDGTCPAVDVTAPTIQFVAPTPANNTIQTSNSFTINVTVNDTQSSIDVCTLEFNGVNETMTKVGSGTFVTCNTTKSGLANGVFTYKVYANDTSNNVNVSETRVITIDNVGPNITLVSPTPANNSFVNSATQTINATVADSTTAVHTCILQFDGVNSSMTKLGSGTTVVCNSTQAGLSDGLHNFTVFANDSANNFGANGTNFFTVDTVNPAIAFVSPTETSGTAQARNYIQTNVTASDTNFKNVTTRLFNGSGLVSSATNTTSPSFVNFTGLIDGTYFFNATAFDLAGNSNSTETRNVTVDTTAPSVTNLVPPANSQFNISQAIEIAANVTDATPVTVSANVTLPNSTVQQLALASAGGNKYNTSFTIPLFGNYNVTFIANDSAGNVNDTERTNFSASGAGAVILVTDNDTYAQGTLSTPEENPGFGIAFFINFTARYYDGLAGFDTPVTDGTCNVMSDRSGVVTPLTFNSTSGNYTGSLSSFREFNLTTFTVNCTSPTYSNASNFTTANVFWFNYIIHPPTAPISFGGPGNNLSSSSVWLSKVPPTSTTPLKHNFTFTIAPNVSQANRIFFCGSNTVQVCAQQANFNMQGDAILRANLSASANNVCDLRLCYRLSDANLQSYFESCGSNVDLTTTPTVYEQTVPLDGVTLTSGTFITLVAYCDGDPSLASITSVNLSVYYNYSGEPISLEIHHPQPIRIVTTVVARVQLENSYLVGPNGTANMSQNDTVNFNNTGPARSHIFRFVPETLSEFKPSIIANSTVVYNSTGHVWASNNASVPAPNELTLTLANGNQDTINYVTEIIPNGTTVNETVLLKHFNAIRNNETLLNDTANEKIWMVELFTIFTDVVTINNVTTYTNYSTYGVPDDFDFFVNITNDSGEFDISSQVTQYTNNKTLTFPVQNLNNNVTFNITARDGTAPSVTNVNASPSVVNQTDTVNITANVTDDIAVDTVLANITFPNDTSLARQLFSSVGTGYFGNFTPALTDPPGVYNVTIVANDTIGNVNNTERTNFTVISVDAANPEVIALLPVENTNFTINETVEIKANVIDNSSVNVRANVTLPNGTILVVPLSNGGGNYSANFTNLLLKGRYNITFIANDTNGNTNDTTTTYFNRKAPDANNTIDVINSTSNILTYTVTTVGNDSGLLNLSLDISGSRVQTINITNYPEDSPYSVLILDDPDPVSVTPPGTFAFYIIDPDNLNFTDLGIEVNATGNGAVFKCTDYNSTEDYCQVDWEELVDIEPGEIYELFLTPGDPAFLETSEGVDVDMIPISDTAFVVGFVDSVESKIAFKVLNTNGSIITDTVDVDTSIDATSSRVALATINATRFVITWVDGLDDDVTMAIYYTNGTNILAATDVDTDVGLNSDVSATQLGDRYFVCYANDADNDADFQAFFNNGTQAVAEGNVDTDMSPGATLQNLVECSAINGTRLSYFWFDDGSNDVTESILDNAGTVIAGPTDLDLAAGETAQVAVAGLDRNKFAMIYYDSADTNIYIAIRTIGNGVILAPTSIDADAGTLSRVAIAPLKLTRNAANDSFVVAWQDQEVGEGDIKVAVYYNNGTEFTSPFTVDPSPDPGFTLIDVMSRDPITNNTICDGRFIVAYTNSSDVGVFKGFYANGTSWDGTCDRTAPNITIIAPTPANNSFIATSSATINASVVNGISPIDICALQFDGVNETMTKIGSGISVICNTTKSGLAEGLRNFTVFANDTEQNTGANGTWFFTVDTIAPAIAFVAPTEANGSVFGRNYIQTNVSVTDVNFKNVTIRLFNSSGLVAAITNTTAVALNNFTGLVDGVYSFNATAVDEAGNTNSTETRIVTIDTAAPIVTYVSPTPSDSSFVNTNYIFVNITAVNGLSAIDVCTLDFDGTNSTMTKVGSGSSVSCNANNTGLADGAYTFIAYANDTLGNLGSAGSRTVTVDTVAPTIDGVNVTNITGTSAIVNWGTNEAANSTVRYGTTNTSLPNSASNSTFALLHNITLSGLSGSTTYFFNVTSCDQAGNCNTTGVFNFTTLAAPAPPAPPGGGAGGGFIAPTQPNITPAIGAEITIDDKAIIPLLNDIDIIQVFIDVFTRATISFRAVELTNGPSDAPPLLAPVYKYFEIVTDLEDSNVENATIMFRVNKTWIQQNDINISTVVMHRYTTQWNALPTVQIDEDFRYVYYEAQTPDGFSLFGVNATRAPPIIVIPPVEVEFVPSQLVALLILVILFIIATRGRQYIVAAERKAGKKFTKFAGALKDIFPEDIEAEPKHKIHRVEPRERLPEVDLEAIRKSIVKSLLEAREEITSALAYKRLRKLVKHVHTLEKGLEIKERPVKKKPEEFVVHLHKEKVPEEEFFANIKKSFGKLRQKKLELGKSLHKFRATASRISLPSLTEAPKEVKPKAPEFDLSREINKILAGRPKPKATKTFIVHLHKEPTLSEKIESSIKKISEALKQKRANLAKAYSQLPKVMPLFEEKPEPKFKISKKPHITVHLHKERKIEESLSEGVDKLSKDLKHAKAKAAEFVAKKLLPSLEDDEGLYTARKSSATKRLKKYVSRLEDDVQREERSIGQSISKKLRALAHSIQDFDDRSERSAGRLKRHASALRRKLATGKRISSRQSPRS